MTELIADVGVNAPLKQLFSYAVPAALAATAQVGMRVRVPFGRRRTVGVILTLRRGAGDDLKRLEAVLDHEPLVPESLVRLLRWAAEYYCHPIGQVIKNALPADLGSDRGRTKIATEPCYRCTAETGLPRGKRQQAVLAYIREQGPSGLGRLRRHFPSPHAVLKALVEKGYLLVDEGERIRDPFLLEAVPADKCPALNPAQTAACDEVCSAMVQQAGSAFLLHGVTGSGKTEVYLKSVESCLELQRQALVLVPEISLTPQLVARFRARFAARGYRIAVLHSGLSAGERFDAWREIARGRREIVVGARSAVFAPLQNLGLIVVDEEHDSSYKQGEGFRYNARDLALVRGRQQRCPVVLGSATPSLGSYFRSEKDGLLRRLSLPDRVHQGGMPQVELIDLRGTATAGALSNALIEAIREALEHKEQVLLLLNRRGYAPFLLCRDCGASFHCPNCSISLTFHQRNRQLRCHYCDYSEPVPETCRGCRGLNIDTQGAGTERLEEELNELFPTANIARMDRDSTHAKGSHQRIVNAMLERKVDILLGTQMVAKGHDFPGVGLVGVISADGVLNLPDFRCSERGFSLLTQVAGRAGRLAGGGRVLIQTYNPEHYALQSAVSQDYRQFYQQELVFRRELSYPPYGHLANLVFSGNSLALVQTAAQEYLAFLTGFCAAIQVLGPSPCPLARLRGKHRYQILLKSEERRKLREVLARLDDGRSRLPRQVGFQVDVDPVDML